MAAGCKGVTAATALTLTFTLAGGATPLTVATTMGTITRLPGAPSRLPPSAVDGHLHQERIDLTLRYGANRERHVCGYSVRPSP